MGGGHGSDAVYRMDLRSLAALRAEVEGSASGDAQGHRGLQKEERSGGRTQDLRSVALRSASRVLHGAELDARFAAGVALPEPGGAGGDSDEEPHCGSADGDGDALQQKTSAREKVLQRVSGDP